MILSKLKASTGGFTTWGLMPARAPRSRPLVSVAFGSLPTPRPYAVPCGQPVNAPLDRAGHLRPTKPRKVHGFKFKAKGHHMSKSTNRPSHRVYAVSKNGERNFWQPIGAAWAHGDGEGFNLKLDYLPLNGAEIVIRKPKTDTSEVAADEFTAAASVAAA
jgi:hypothetical protein